MGLLNGSTFSNHPGGPKRPFPIPFSLKFNQRNDGNPSKSRGTNSMVEDPKWELAIVETVYCFYRKLLREHVQEPVPLPEDLHLISLGELDQHFPDPLARI